MLVPDYKESRRRNVPGARSKGAHPRLLSELPFAPEVTGGKLFGSDCRKPWARFSANSLRISAGPRACATPNEHGIAGNRFGTIELPSVPHAMQQFGRY